MSSPERSRRRKWRVKALRETGAAGRLVTVGHELIDETRAALMDGLFDIVISHPLSRLVTEAIASMVAAVANGGVKPVPAVPLPFDIHTSENL